MKTNKHRRKGTLLAIILFLSIFILYTLYSSGFFRIIEPKLDGEIIRKVAIKGAEDIMVSTEDKFALISATDRSNVSKNINKESGLFLMDLKSNEYKPILLTESLNIDFEPHGISFYKKDSIYHVMVINHANEGHTIEVFELLKNNLVHKKTLRDSSMIRPNDLVMIDENRFYFTNDHKFTKGIGKVVEEYIGLALSNVVYYDGTKYSEAVSGIAYANGINFDRERSLLYVASTRGFEVKVYSRAENGQITFIEDIPCKTGVDNIEFDTNNDLWIGSHPSLLKYTSYSKGDKEIAPSEVIKISYKNKGDYSIEKIYIEEGRDMSGSSVAAIYEDKILVGNVMDHQFLVIRKNKD